MALEDRVSVEKLNQGFVQEAPVHDLGDTTPEETQVNHTGNFDGPLQELPVREFDKTPLKVADKLHLRDADGKLIIPSPTTLPEAQEVNSNFTYPDGSAPASEWTPRTTIEKSNPNESRRSHFWTKGKLIAILTAGGVAAGGVTTAAVISSNQTTHIKHPSPDSGANKADNANSGTNNQENGGNTKVEAGTSHEGLVVAGKTPEQLQAEFTIPSSVDIKDLPQAFIDKINEWLHGGANPTDIPPQNWDIKDPHLSEVAASVNTAASLGLFDSLDNKFNKGPNSIGNSQVNHLYYYGKTEFEEAIYPNTKPYLVTASIDGDVKTFQKADKDWLMDIPVRTSDNAKENSVQSTLKQQGDKDGQFITTGIFHLIAHQDKENNKWSFTALEGETITPNS